MIALIPITKQVGSIKL